MARLPSDLFLIQQIGDSVILFQCHTEQEIVRYPVADREATAQAQATIASSELSDEDKSFAHFWSGYFYALTCHLPAWPLDEHGVPRLSSLRAHV